MARDNSYILFSREAYEGLPVTQSFLDERGPLYFPPVDDEEQGELMTPDNATIQDAYETRYGAPLALNVVDDIPTRCEYADCNHVILTLPNMEQEEMGDIIDIARSMGIERPVIMSHKRTRAFLNQSTDEI